MIIWTIMKIYFSSSYQNFQKYLFPELILFIEYIAIFDFLNLMDVLVIFFWTVPGIYVVN